MSYASLADDVPLLVPRVASVRIRSRAEADRLKRRVVRAVRLGVQSAGFAVLLYSGVVLPGFLF